MQPTKKVSPAIATLIVIALLAIIAAIVVIANQSKDAMVSETTQTEATQTTPASTSETPYKDGTYTETGVYISPGGRESIEVSLTIEGDIVTEATVTGDATSGEAKEHQEDFISGYKSFVVGKNIDEVSLSRVAGSSLTSNGFNAALEAIKADAQA